MGGKRAFYLSYAWDQEEKDGFVTALEQACANPEWSGLELRRDVNRVEIGGDLAAFVQEIGQSGCVVAVISDAYLRSVWCMSELLAVHRHGGLSGRLIPVNLSKVDFNNTKTWDEISNHWNGEVDKSQFDSRQYGATLVTERATRRDEVVLIYQNVDTLLGFLRTRLAATHADDAPKILAKVKEYLGVPPDEPPPLPQHPILEEEFTKELETQIEDVFLGKGLGARVQGERIQGALRELLKKKGVTDVTPAHWLASRTEPLAPARLLRQAIRHLRGEGYTQDKALWVVAEQLFGLVLLRAVNPEWVSNYYATLEKEEKPQLRFRLVSEAAVEILISRLHPELQDIPMFESREKEEVRGRKRLNNHLRNAHRADTVIDRGVKDDFVQEILRELWCAITPDGRKGEKAPLNIMNHLEDLRDYLGYRHEDGDAPYLIINADDRSNRLNEDAIQQQLHEALHSLHMVFLTTQEGDGWDRLLLFNKQSNLMILLKEFLFLEPKP